MRKFHYYLWAALAALFICACAQQPPAKDTVESVTRATIHAQKQADAAELASVELLGQSAITSAQAQRVYQAADVVRIAARTTRQMLAAQSQPEEAAASLRGAQASLTFLEQFLTEHKRSK